MDADRTGPPGSPRGSAESPDPPADPTAAYEYGYGPAQSGTPSATTPSPTPPSPPDPGPTGQPPAAASPEPPGADAPPDEPADPTQITSVTGVRGTTAPRAVLRPVPEGFPTPPPRPARPNRRPAAAPAAQAPPRRRGLLIAALSVVAVLILGVGIGGSILAYRALSSPEQGGSASPGQEQPAGGDTGELVLGSLTVREVSTEVGVASVGDQNSTREAEGEFVVVTYEIHNDSSEQVTVSSTLELTTAEGDVVEPDTEATTLLLAESKPYGVVPPGESATFHAVYDVPIGATPQSLQVDFSTHIDGGSGELDLAS